MTAEDMKEMMSEMMPEMMDNCFSSMNADEMNEMMHETMPKMMEKCFSKMSLTQRKKMMTMCRTMLDKIEKKSLVTTTNVDPFFHRARATLVNAYGEKEGKV